VLVFGAHPCSGDWFGGLRADDAEAFISALSEMEYAAGTAFSQRFIDEASVSLLFATCVIGLEAMVARAILCLRSGGAVGWAWTKRISSNFTVADACLTTMRQRSGQLKRLVYCIISR
jgi:hypothetical protein